MTELKLCPFCGKEAYQFYDDPEVQHPCCSMSDDKMSIELWNTRPIEDSLQQKLTDAINTNIHMARDRDSLHAEIDKYQWISVKNRLPEKDCAYQVYAPDSPLEKIWDCQFYTDVGWFGTGYNVTHWMPLPEPPTEKE
jgi:hypothetical protein